MPDMTAFIGIDPTSGVRSMTCAILTDRLKIDTLVTASFDELTQVIIPRYTQAVCAINSPAGPNRSLLADPSYREQVGLNPNRDNYSDYRVCEYELRRRGVYVGYTPSDYERVPVSVQEGWALYERLQGRGYVVYPHAGPLRLLETNAQAIFTLLVKKHPYTKNSLEGLLQRQLILHEEGLDVPDPIYTLQEWTRHRLLTGTVNMTDVLNPAQLDALASAYVAYLVDREPGRVTTVGDEAEGEIVLPTPELADAY